MIVDDDEVYVMDYSANYNEPQEAVQEEPEVKPAPQPEPAKEPVKEPVPAKPKKEEPATTDVDEEDEESSEPQKPFVTEMPSNVVETDKPVFEARKPKDDNKYAITTFNYPSALNYEWRDKDNNAFNDELFAAYDYHHTPALFMNSPRAGTKFSNAHEFAGTKLRTTRARIGMEGELKGMAAVEAVRRAGGSGNTIRYFLPRSCIWITQRPASEPELADLDYAISTNENAVGRSTAGILLDAGSGSFNEAIIELALSTIVGTNVSNLGGDMAMALAERIDLFDLQKVIAHMLIALYPDGYPWDFACSNPKCGHVSHDQSMNFARATLDDLGSLTDDQMDSLIKHRNTITDAEIQAYKEQFKLTDKNFVDLENANVRIHLKSATLADYMMYSKVWIKSIETKYTKALTKFSTEAKRDAYIRTQVQANRFQKYRHLIEKISIPKDNCEITDAESIDSCLAALDTTNSDFYKFESAVLDFIESNTLSIFGYPSKPCPACNVEPVNASGKFKGIVPVSADRVFFTLAQLRTMAMAQLGDE